jgi:HAMP domain-containing protein
MTIRRKLWIAMGVPLAAFVILAVICYVQVGSMSRFVAHVTEVESVSNRAAFKMQVDLVEMGFQLQGYLRDHDASRLELIKTYKDDFRENQSTYSRLVEATRAESSADKVDKDCAVFSKALEEVINLENYQAEKLAKFRANLAEMDGISCEEYRTYVDASEPGAFDKFKAFSQMRIKVDDIEESLNCYLMNGSDECEKRAYDSQEAFSRLIDNNPVLASKPWLPKLKDIHSENAGLIREIIALEKEQRAGLQEFVKVKERLRVVLEGSIARAAVSFENIRQQSSRAVSISAGASTAAVILGLIAVMISYVCVTYSITQPIGKLRDAVIRVNSGRYDEPIEVESDDEFGQLADSISKMADELKRTRLSPAAPEKATARYEKTGMTM